MATLSLVLCASQASAQTMRNRIRAQQITIEETDTGVYIDDPFCRTTFEVECSDVSITRAATGPQVRCVEALMTAYHEPSGGEVTVALNEIEYPGGTVECGAPLLRIGVYRVDAAPQSDAPSGDCTFGDSSEETVYTLTAGPALSIESSAGAVDLHARAGVLVDLDGIAEPPDDSGGGWTIGCDIDVHNDEASGRVVVDQPSAALTIRLPGHVDREVPSGIHSSPMR